MELRAKRIRMRKCRKVREMQNKLGGFIAAERRYVVTHDFVNKGLKHSVTVDDQLFWLVVTHDFANKGLKPMSINRQYRAIMLYRMTL